MKILKEDIELVEARLIEIVGDLKELAEEFRVTLNQSSETWHDNSPWEQAKQREKLLLNEEHDLKLVLKEAEVLGEDKNFGQKHKVEYNGRTVRVLLVGDFTLRGGQMIDEHIVVTSLSPIGKHILLKS